MGEPAESALLRQAGELLRPLAREFVRLIVGELRSGELQAQQGSPLGARRHRAAVQRRIKAGLGGAYVVGRELLLTREALLEELRTMTGPKPGLRKAKADPALEALRAETERELRSLRRVK